MTADTWMRDWPGGKRISALGFGCSSVWAQPSFSEGAAQAILRALLDEGVNHFDTSPSYGHGAGERRLGAFIAASGADRQSLIISTKVGTNLIDGHIVRSFDRAAMEASFRSSLARLGLDAVDVLYLHGPALTDLTDATWRVLDDMKARGLAALVGVNSFDNAVLDACVDAPVDAVMLQYNIADFRNEAAMKRLHAAGKTIVSGTALARAQFDLAAFIPTDRTRLWYLLRMLRRDPGFFLRAPALKRRLEATGSSAPAAALRFVCGHPMITTSLFGTRSIDHAVANARAGHQLLTTQQWTSLASYA